ncbi:CCA tRNA nucleotidyltransferase [Salimicrobium flavidum]|uniref:tRNA nucleotidyltransferase (CCA-adding enzyme) n=1 Tax=Salimicrobium flavidum TaxID=570947 RepID=A0A1N7IJC8_9BACI|nr:CCA tRNA nucleotidyltransferase [Salimicrobium flavidum]SIS37195.1 tRNA nucleotidyltransferase (CCA-adding enzyme) [Salimicrobium flavidum]
MVNYDEHPLLKRAAEVISIIEEHGGEAFIVGGCVRDYFLGHEMKDADIATSLLPEQIMDIFDKVIPVGLEHGTVIVRHHSHSFEVTTYRMEEDYEDYRHPNRVYFVTSIEKDLSRRDFSMNAMALAVNGDIIDPFRGQRAIQERRIETVGAPAERFAEDPLRMMRAIRFSAQLDFSIDHSVTEVITEKRNLLQFLSVERLASEFGKMMTSPFYRKGWNYLLATKSFQYLPVFQDHPALVQREPLVLLSDWGELIGFYHLSYEDVSPEEWVSAWRLSNQVKRKAKKITEAAQMYQREGMSGYMLYRLGGAYIKSWENVMHSLNYSLPEDPTIKYASLPIHSRADLDIDTYELFRLFPERKRGKWIGEYIDYLLRIVAEGTSANNRDELIKWVKERDRQKGN